jgi:hypothetical protein
MNLLKTPHQLLLEEAGATPASPGLLHTPKQMLMQEAGMTPKFAGGGKIGNLAKFLSESKIPQRLYHGTTASEEKGDKALSQLKQSKEGALGSGVYMTPNPEFAGQYANQPGGYIMPVHANLRNPLEIRTTSGVEGNGDPMKLALMQLGVPEAKADQILEKAYDTRGYVGKEVMSRAQKQGYDGIAQYRDGELSEVVSYNPMGVKSAIGNTGEFDPYDPRLSKAEGGHISVNDMLAEIIAANQTPQKFAQGGSTMKNIGIQSALSLPFMAEDAQLIAKDIKEKRYPEAAARTAGVGYSAFTPFNPLTALISGLTYSSETGDATLDAFLAKKEEMAKMQEAAKNQKPPRQREQHNVIPVTETRFYKN